jgi:hypothetical protein
MVKKKQKLSFWNYIVWILGIIALILLAYGIVKYLFWA